jgi:hypothetical protein
VAIFKRRAILLLLSWGLTLCACSFNVSSPPPIPVTTTEAAPVSPTVTPEAQNCGYQWAYQDLPELSSSFQESIHELQSEAQARAFAFGEKCMLADGSVGYFLAMETDFNVTLQVEDLVNEDNLGRWIVKVMGVIESIPADQLVGPRPGRVSLNFQDGADQTFTRFYINEYQALPAGLTNAEIYRALQTPR